MLMQGCKQLCSAAQHRTPEVDGSRLHGIGSRGWVIHDAHAADVNLQCLGLQIAGHGLLNDCSRALAAVVVLLTL